ncbi:MAG: FAD-binding oxidoreductase [Chitinophagales bacterium]
MATKLNRNQFIKLTTLGAVGFFINSCNTNSTENTNKESVTKDTLAATQDTTVATPSFTDADVIFYKKDDTHYESLRIGFNKRVQKFPLVIALCKTTLGVQAAIHYANENKLPIAVKSGGHCFEGFSSNDNGLVINLSEMHAVDFLENDLVKVQPGCKLHQLYDAILPKGKIIPAGSCGGVGVGGLALGGGYGFFSRKYGLTCDSLQEITLVDAQGTIHHSKDNPELLWACRGGGNGNFGVVTEMVFKSYNASNHFTSHRFKVHHLDADKAKTILEKWFRLTANLPVACFSAFVLNGKTLNILLTDYENNPSAVQQFKETLTPLVEQVTIGEPKPLAASLKNYYGIQYPIYFKNSSAGLYENFATIQSFIGDVIQKVIDTPGMIYQVNTLGGAINNADFEKGSAYPHRALPYLSELQTYWESAAQTKRFETAFEEVQQIFKANNIRTQYRNYPDLNFEDAQHLYYGKNYERLQSIKQQFDPNNVFGYSQSVQSV